MRYDLYYFLIRDIIFINKDNLTIVYLVISFNKIDSNDYILLD